MKKTFYLISGGVEYKDRFKKGSFFANPDGYYFTSKEKAIKYFNKVKVDKYLKNYNYNNEKVAFTFLEKLVVDIEKEDLKNNCFDWMEILDTELIKSYVHDNNGTFKK